MTRRDFIIKWGVYALALLLVYLVEIYVLSAFPILGVVPLLLPQAAIVVAVLEGPVGGAGFGLAVGLLFDTAHHGAGGMTLVLTLLGMSVGVLAWFALRQNLLSCLICSAGALCLIGGIRVLAHLMGGVTSLSVLMRVAGLEALWSLILVAPIYALFLWVFHRVPKKTVL